MNEDYLLKIFGVRGGIGEKADRYTNKKLDISDPTVAFNSGLLNVFSYGGLRLTPYVKTLKHFFIVLKMSGDVFDYAVMHNATGPYDLRKERGKPVLSIDLVVPRAIVEVRKFEEYRDWVVGALRECFEVLIASAKKRGELLDEAGLRAEIAIGLAKLSSTPEGDVLWSPEGRGTWRKPEAHRTEKMDE
ncbi:hypothetical protein [Burkholderia sp. BCC0405]|uniref:hypothetical protein n=1 Tax=Burkholderia sp. BCC0405 TaxID=2676298 RepID=UPI001589B0AB|nr:hypothetical protein [Burkholderia sp. BCC0405]